MLLGVQRTACAEGVCRGPWLTAAHTAAIPVENIYCGCRLANSFGGHGWAGLWVVGDGTEWLEPRQERRAAAAALLAQTHKQSCELLAQIRAKALGGGAMKGGAAMKGRVEPAGRRARPAWGAGPAVRAEALAMRYEVGDQVWATEPSVDSVRPLRPLPPVPPVPPMPPPICANLVAIAADGRWLNPSPWPRWPWPR